MTRTNLLKWLNGFILAGLFGSSTIFEFFIGHPMNRSQELLRLSIVLGFLILLTKTSRELFISIRFIRKQNYAAAIQHANTYLDNVRQHPWKRVLFLIRIPVYTTMPEVAALSVLGQAYTLSGDSRRAIMYLNEAANIDPKSPTVFAALSIAASAMEDKEAAINYLNKSRDLGYSGSFSDMIFGGGELFSAAMAAISSKIT